MHKVWVKQLEDLIPRCNLNISFLQNQAARMYNNHAEYLRETSYFRKILQEKLGNITAEHNYLKKVHCFQ